MAVSRKILIIEDDKDYRSLLVDTFSPHGYTILEAPDGELGLATALREHPDLILLDLRMPRMDGMQVLEKLRSDPWGKDAAVFLLTSVDPDDTIVDQVSKLTPSYYFLKKGDMLPSEIVDKIKEKLG